jgi:hypothetical protein
LFIVIICFNDCIYYEWLEKETYCYMDGKAVLYIEQCRYAICYRIMDQFENRLGRNSFFRPIATLLPQILLGPFTALLQTQVEPSFLGRVFSLFGGISLLSFGYRFVYNRNYWRFGRNSRGIYRMWFGYSGDRNIGTFHTFRLETGEKEMIVYYK